MPFSVYFLYICCHGNIISNRQFEGSTGFCMVAYFPLSSTSKNMIPKDVQKSLRNHLSQVNFLCRSSGQ